MRNKTATLILGLLAFGLLIAGCGSSGSDGDATGASIDKATFVKQANTVCEQARGKLAAEVAAVSKREGAKPGYDRIKTRMILIKGTLTPALQAELDELRALGMPSEAKGEVQAFLAALQGVIKRAEANPMAFGASANPYEAAELAGRKVGVLACPIAFVNTN